MPDLSGLGDLVLTVGGDITPLTDALDSIPAVASQAASQIQAAFDAIPSATDNVAQGLAALGEAATAAGADAAAAGVQLTEMTTGVAEGASAAAASVEQMPPALHETAEAAAEAESSLKEFIITGLELAGVVLSLEALKEAVLGSLEAFGELQTAGIALTAITGDAEAARSALEGIPEVADKIGASMQTLEQASVVFARFGVDLEQLPGLFSSIADAALGSAKSFDTVTSAWERVTLTGAVTAKSIMNLGLSVSDLAQSLGLSADASIKEVSASMQGLGDASSRAAVLMAAVPDSVKGLAEASDTVTKAFQQMENAVTLAKEHIGQALADLSQAGGMEVLKTSIKLVETAIVSMIGFLGQAIDLIRGFGKMVGDEFSAVGQAFHDAVAGQWDKAVADLKAGDDKAAQDFQLMGQQMTLDWTKNGNIIDDIWNQTTTKVAASAAKIPQAMAAAAADVVAQGIHTQQVLVEAEEGLTNSWSDLSKQFDAVTKQMNADIDIMNNGVPKTAASMNALQGMVNSLADMQSKLQNQGLLNSINAMAAGLDLTAASAKEGDATISQFFADISAGSHDTVPILMATAGAATKIGDNIVNASKQWSTFISTAKDAASQIAAMEAGERAFGIESQVNFDARIRAATSLLQIMQQQNQPMAEQLKLETDILNSELAHAQAIGASGTATLHLTEQLEAAKVQTGLITDATMGLSNLYTTMLKDFGTAWTNLGKGIGDALVSGQNFGAAMTSVFDSLKKSIAELVTNYLLGLLKDSLLQNTNLMQDFNKVFNAIFSSGGTVSTGLQATSQAFASNSQVMVSSFGQATNAVQSGAQSMSSAMSQTASSVTSSAATMLSGLNLIASAIGAIAGIFSAIELAHTNTLLSRIEESTRRTDIVTEQNIVPATTKSANFLEELLSWAWGTATTYLQQINIDLDTIVGNTNTMSGALEAIMQAGVGVGGGGISQTTSANVQALGMIASMALPEAAQMLSDAAGTITDASQVQTTAANTALAVSTQQLSLTNQATAATTYAAVNLSTAAQSMTSAADAISNESLKAADAAQTQAAAAAALAGSARALTDAMGNIHPSSTFLQTLGGTVGSLYSVPTGPGGSSTFSPTTMPVIPGLPNVGPNPASSGGLMPATWTPAYQATVGGTGPVNITVNGSQFVQSLMNEFIRSLQNQGITLRRG